MLFQLVLTGMVCRALVKWHVACHHRLICQVWRARASVVVLPHHHRLQTTQVSVHYSLIKQIGYIVCLRLIWDRSEFKHEIVFRIGHLFKMLMDNDVTAACTSDINISKNWWFLVPTHLVDTWFSLIDISKGQLWVWAQWWAECRQKGTDVCGTGINKLHIAYFDPMCTWSTDISYFPLTSYGVP